MVQQWIHAHAPVYIPSGSQLFGVCPQEFRNIWLSEEMRCTSLAFQWRHAHASVYGGGHFTRPSSAVSPEKYRNLNTLGDDFRSCFRILGSIADTRAHVLVHEFWGKLHVFPREGGPPEVDTGYCSHLKVWTLFQWAMYLAFMRQTTVAAGRIPPFST